MIELFSTLTISQLFIFIVMIMLAAKELITILDFFWIKLRSIFDKEYKVKDEKKEILDSNKFFCGKHNHNYKNK